MGRAMSRWNAWRVLKVAVVLVTYAPEWSPNVLGQEAVAKPPIQATKATNGAKSGAQGELPIERQAYRILMHFDCSPAARIDAGRRAELLKNWQVLARSYVGAPWLVTLAAEASANGMLELRTLKPEMLTNVEGFDKLWLIHVDRSATGGELEISGREYDAATRQVGPLLIRKGLASADAARGLLRFTLDLFNPTGLVVGQSGGRALLSIRGMLIEPASPIGAVIKKGSVLVPMRITMEKSKAVVRRIDHTYLEVESIEGAVARCAILSGHRDPLTQRTLLPTTIAAVGIKPGNSPIRLRFEARTVQVTKPGEPRKPPILAPAAGYLLTARGAGEGVPRELGLTDRSGRIVLQPGFADRLIILRLLAGNVEPMVELPMMPGESEQEQVITFPPRPETVALEAELEALRDEVVDLVAMRKRLEGRMKARLDGEDYPGLQAAVREYQKLTPREEMAKRLTAIRDDAVKRNAASHVGLLTKTAQAQLNDMQSMIDAYLEEDTLKSYADVIERNRAEGAAVAAKKAALTKSTAKPRAVAVTKQAPAQTPEPRARAPEKPAAKPKATPDVPF